MLRWEVHRNENNKRPTEALGVYSFIAVCVGDRHLRHSQSCKIFPGKFHFGECNKLYQCLYYCFVCYFCYDYRRIDIQASSLIGLTSICIGVLWSDLGLNIWTAVLLAMLLSTFCGALSGYFIAYCGVQPMVVTLGRKLTILGTCTAYFRSFQNACLSGH